MTYERRLSKKLPNTGIRRSCVKTAIIAQLGQTGRAGSVHWLFMLCGLFHIVPSECTKRNFWSSKQYVNTVIILNLNIYYRQEKCALLGCYAASSVNFCRRFETTYRSIFKCILALSGNLLPMIQDILPVIRSTVFWPLMFIYYRRFGRTYRSILQVHFVP
jgi:hypothetical protein